MIVKDCPHKGYCDLMARKSYIPRRRVERVLREECASWRSVKVRVAFEDLGKKLLGPKFKLNKEAR